MLGFGLGPGAAGLSLEVDGLMYGCLTKFAVGCGRTELPREVDGVEVTAEQWFEKAVESMGTTGSCMYGDRGVLDSQILGLLDESHFVGWQAVLMPRGVSDRDFLTLARVDRDSLKITNKSFDGRAVTSLAESVGNSGLVRGKAMMYGFRFEPPSDPQKGCQFVAFEHFDPQGGVLPAMVNLDLVGRARAKGVRGMARRLGLIMIKLAQQRTRGAVGSSDGHGGGVTFRQNLTYRFELLSMLLDQVSRKQHRVAQVVSVIDMAGTRAEHRRLFPHIKEVYAVTDAISASSSVFLVSAVNSIVATLWGSANRLLSETTRASLLLQPLCVFLLCYWTLSCAFERALTIGAAPPLSHFSRDTTG